MTRKTAHHTLQDRQGRLTRDFSQANMQGLHARFVASGLDKQKARGLLAGFYLAAEKLKAHEARFDRTVDVAATGLDLKANLRSHAHMADMRRFHQAKNAILVHNENLGRLIARAAMADMITDVTVKTSHAQNIKAPATKRGYAPP